MKAFNPSLKNDLLTYASSELYNELSAHWSLVHLELGKVLYESGEPVKVVYFPLSAIISLLYVMKNGDSAEISVVGKDGVLGLAVLFGGESTTTRSLVQSAGYAYRLNAGVFKNLCLSRPELMLIILLYSQALMTQIAQTAACNRHHSIDQQLCRWLLLSLDRLTDNNLTMTQELIANMLGVRREGVTEAAGKLQKLGAIEYSRGHIRVLNRALIERLSCECYGVVKVETARMMASLIPSGPQRIN